MQPAPIPENEQERLVSLYTLGLLDTSPEKRFDLITRTAVRIFHVPISTLTLIDSKREWFKSYQGLPQREGGRAVSFCGHALLSDNILVIPDTWKDDRFADNPMVIGKPYLRFYAGVPVMNIDGQRIGAFCVKDTKPRAFSKDDEEILKGIASWAELEINFHNLSLAWRQGQKLEQKLKTQARKARRLNMSQEKIKKAMLNIMEDLEETKSMLELQKAKNEAILASIGDGIVAIDQDEKVIVINQAGCNLLGFKSVELLGKKFFDAVEMVNEKGEIIAKDKRPELVAISGSKFTTTTTTTTTTGHVYHYMRKDKTFFPVAITVTPIINGKIIGAIEVFRDITREIEIDKAKSEFVSLASHQLRTPLGIMKWYIEALENVDYFRDSPMVIRNYFDEIDKSNERVLSLVRDLLSVSRIDQERVKDNPKPIDLIQSVIEIVEQMQIVAHQKKVSLRLTIQNQKIPPINIDILRFHEVIENLIDNALEYTIAAGFVDVIVNKLDDTLLISVKDTGIGISVTDQNKLFTKFFRSEKVIGYNSEGSGLGLYVVKSYIEGWGGKIFVDSIEGKGSTFTISLPMSQKKHI